MSQETHSKPVLDAESFQRLLAAAYMLQSCGNGTSTQSIRSGDTKSFVARSLVQKRTPSIQPRLARSRAGGKASAVLQLARPMVWKKVEALAIALVFCLMMGISIHRLVAFPGRTPSPSGIPEPRDTSSPARFTPTVLTSAQHLTETQEFNPSDGNLEGDAFGDDLVIQYHPPTIHLSGHAEKESQRLSGRDAILETGARGTRRKAEMPTESVVQYGDDVTVWSSGPWNKSALTRDAR